MIRINLLPEKKKKRLKGKAYYFTLLGIVSLITTLVLIGVFYYLKTDISNIKTKIESNKLILAELSRKINEAKRYEQLNKEITYRNNIIETLKKNQAVPVKILNDVSMYLPQGVWLNSLIYKDEGIEIEGHAFTNFNIVSYVENLKRLKHLTDVYLIESKESEVEKVRVYMFKITFKVNI